jgi:hypothetical protein
VSLCGLDAHRFVTQSIEKRLSGQFTKADADLGLVFGWAIVCTEKGTRYFDTQGDHIPDDEMLKASTAYMRSPRSMGVNHEKRATVVVERGVVKYSKSAKRLGTIVHSWPMTSEVAKAFGFPTRKTGWLIAAMPDDKDVVKRVDDGELVDFSIGGWRGEDEVIE